MNRFRILLAEDDASLRRVTALQLQKWGHEVVEVADGNAAVEAFRDGEFDLVLTDLVMEGFTGAALIGELRATRPGVIVVVFTAFGTVENAVEAMKAGAWDYLAKPVHPEELRLVVGRALEHRNLRLEVAALRSAIDGKYGFENIVGQSPALLEVLDTAIRIAASDVTVLITGETGTGKELLARALHANSLRAGGPFVTVNCAAIPRELIESELFGHVKGSFTGAIATKPGKAELADGGTLFLDEIGELPFDLQGKLLRLIQQSEVSKIGSSQTQKVDVRILAATNRELAHMVRENTFREDLFYRLAVVPLRMPPLRERSEDIPLLVERFFAKYRDKHRRPALLLPDSVSQLFAAGHHWPGNIRELENAVERAVLLARGASITPTDLPECLQTRRSTLETLRFAFPPQGVSLDAVEKELLRHALERSNGNRSLAARLLRITRKTFLWRLEKHGLGVGQAE